MLSQRSGSTDWRCCTKAAHRPSAARPSLDLDARSLTKRALARVAGPHSAASSLACRAITRSGTMFEAQSSTDMRVWKTMSAPTLHGLLSSQCLVIAGIHSNALAVIQYS